MSFKARLFLLYLKKLPWKSFGIFVTSENGKNCPQPRAASVSDFKELPKQLSQTILIREHPEDKLWENLIIPSVNLLKVLAMVKAA